MKRVVLAVIVFVMLGISSNGKGQIDFTNDDSESEVSGACKVRGCCRVRTSRRNRWPRKPFHCKKGSHALTSNVLMGKRGGMNPGRYSLHYGGDTSYQFWMNRGPVNIPVR